MLTSFFSSFHFCKYFLALYSSIEQYAACFSLPILL